MAQPVPLEIAPRNQQAELRNRLNVARDEHAEALLAAYELLQQMHEQGVLEMGIGILSARDEILGTLARTASTPDAIQAIRNLLALQRVLGSIPADRFQTIIEAVPEGLAQAAAQPQRPVTIFSLLRQMVSPESLRAIAAALSFLQGLGRRLLAK